VNPLRLNHGSYCLVSSHDTMLSFSLDNGWRAIPPIFHSDHSEWTSEMSLVYYPDHGDHSRGFFCSINSNVRLSFANNRIESDGNWTSDAVWEPVYNILSPKVYLKHVKSGKFLSCAPDGLLHLTETQWGHEEWTFSLQLPTLTPCPSYKFSRGDIGCYCKEKKGVVLYTHVFIVLGPEEGVIEYTGSTTDPQARIQTSKWDKYNDKELFKLTYPLILPKHPDEIIRNATFRLDETKYHVVNCNCEHFATWAAFGVGFSPQIANYYRNLAGSVAQHTVIPLGNLFSKRKNKTNVEI